MADESADIIQVFGRARSDCVAEGLRLIKAFMSIPDPALRGALVNLAERMAEAVPAVPAARRDDA